MLGAPEHGDLGSEDRMAALSGKVKALGISMVGIHSNETKDHPADSFDEVKKRMAENPL